MKRLRMICALAFFISVLCVFATAKDQAKPPTKLSPLATEINKEITSLETQFVGVAEAMPADKFAATPENLGVAGTAFKGVRTFAVQVRHVAADNFAIWAPLTGEAEPAGINAPSGPADM